MEQVGPMEEVGEGEFKRGESFQIHKDKKRASSYGRRQVRADVIKCVHVCFCEPCARDSRILFILP